jgi:hypothetical protein
VPWFYSVARLGWPAPAGSSVRISIGALLFGPFQSCRRVAGFSCAGVLVGARAMLVLFRTEEDEDETAPRRAAPSDAHRSVSAPRAATRDPACLFPWVSHFNSVGRCPVVKVKRRQRRAGGRRRTAPHCRPLRAARSAAAPAVLFFFVVDGACLGVTFSFSTVSVMQAGAIIYHYCFSFIILSRKRGRYLGTISFPRTDVRLHLGDAMQGKETVTCCLSASRYLTIFLSSPTDVDGPGRIGTCSSCSPRRSCAQRRADPSPCVIDDAPRPARSSSF